MRSASGGQRNAPSRNQPTGRHSRTVNPVIVELLDHRQFVLEIARPDGAAEHHGIADAQLGDGARTADGVQQLTACVDGVGDRDEMLVELAGGDLLEQLSAT